ncbi:unnamed protein product [Darwinula stevensoni]|uniref:Gustatory receptor n=1 Tax=Darwinula stevensoni TaxID=69355 RepID=A0A7R9AIC4_9CRUS|nr:unnamed protein product [Darwinula stevensoni]CAG0906304.1 unnamed protein product [Darwinula stevensoni]
MRTVDDGQSDYRAATDNSASATASTITLLTVTASILYWHGRGHGMSRLLGLCLELNEGGQGRGQGWGQGWGHWLALLLVVSYGVLFTVLNVLTGDKSAVVALKVVAWGFANVIVVFQPVLYCWVCWEIYRFEKLFIEKIEGAGMTVRRWLDSRETLEHLVLEMNRLYGPLLALHLAFNGAVLTIFVYLAVRDLDRRDPRWEHFAINVANCVGAFIPLLIFNFASEAVERREEHFWKAMAYRASEQAVPLMDGDPLRAGDAGERRETIADKEQMRHMALFYESRMINLTAAGFVNVGKGSLTTLLNVITTYIVILFQFGKEDKNQVVAPTASATTLSVATAFRHLFNATTVRNLVDATTVHNLFNATVIPNLLNLTTNPGLFNGTATTGLFDATATTDLFNGTAITGLFNGTGNATVF